MKPTVSSAVKAIDKKGILLVFPIDNRKEFPSLWSEFHPRTPMRWEWDEHGDDRVPDLWHLKTVLSTTRKVVYAKWFRGRATYFSRPVFTALLKLNRDRPGQKLERPQKPMSRAAQDILSTLQMDSPLSTKQLKAATGLQGKFNETAYTRAMRELWERFLIVSYGEVEDGAFPSSAIGATQMLFEDLWEAAGEMSEDEAQAILAKVPLGESVWFRKKHARRSADRP